MRLHRFWLLVSIGFLYWSAPELRAQVPPPDLQCVVNDTLVWTPATVACGPFQSYRIYRATDAAGPFTLLTEVTDPATVRYYDANPNGELRYYYLESNHDCPGETVLASDTLDNRIPDPPTLRSIRVIDDEVILSWDPSPSPETESYVVYRQTSQGTTPIATVPASQLTYTDPAASAQDGSELYFVTAVDACGSNSLFQYEYETFFLTAAAPDSCSGSVVLEGSGGPVNGELFGWSEIELFVSVDGGPFAAAGVFPANGVFTYDEANDGENLCFYYETIQDNGERSRSSVTCVDVSILQPIRAIYLRGVSVVDGGYQVDWAWDSTARLTAAQVVRIEPGGSEIGISLAQATLPGGELASYFDAAVDVDLAGYRYRIEASDECGNEVASNELAPLLLSGTRTNESYQLSWSAYSSPYLSEVRYRLIRVTDTGEIEVSAGTATTAEDRFDPSDPDQQSQCYYVVAEVTLDLPTGPAVVAVRSNTFCPPPAELAAYVPNAFYPGSIYEENQEFRPFLGPYQVADYLLQVFDRWGGLLFESQDVTQGWDGTQAGDPLPNGSYFYYIYFTTPQGRERSLRGTVNLLR
jgi:gliding motility-associated-like protein